jgi:kinesin family protein 4/21/27
VQGYNVSILAYGQSGAGKSYTMGTTGPSEQEDPRLMGKCSFCQILQTAALLLHSAHCSPTITGVVPRAASALFDKLSPSNGKSGIRSPNRYSMQAMQALSSYSKAHEKTWKMTATYVEV